LAGGGQLVSQPGPFGLQGGDDVDVGGGVEGGRQRPGPFPEDPGGAPGAFHQGLDPAEGGGEIFLTAGGELGGGGRGRFVQGGDGGVEIALLGLQGGQAGGGGGL